MRKRGLGFLLCLVMLVGLLPTTVFAVESATVKTYNELWSAIYSKNDYYITLDSDITYTVPEGGNTPLSPWQYLLNVDGTKNKTIDLNGHTLQVLNEQTSWPTQGGLFNIEDTASLTVMNGTIKLYNYNNSKRTDMGVFNARGGNLTLTNVDVLNCRDGTAVNAQGSATVNIEGGTISAFSGFAVTAVGTSWLTLDKNVVLTTITGSGLITQPADNGYGSLHASTSNLTVVSAMFEAGIEVAESTISQFSASANRLVFVGGTQYNSAFATSKSGDYYWDTNATGGCALVVNDNNYSFAKNVNVISTAAKQPVVVTNGTASPNQAAYGATVTITADNIQGKVFSGWTVESGGVTLADSSAKTTTFTMGAKAVAVKAHYTNVPISSAEFTVATPVQGGHPSAATTTTEHITVSETWCVEKYDENSFSSTLPDSHTFEGGHTYRVGVAFEVEQGYALDNNFAVKFVDPISSTQTTASQGATQYIWLADYTVENNSVEITSVTATVSGAEAGATAGSTTVTTNDTTYTVSIKGWYDCDNVFSYASAPVLQATDTFVGGKTYTVGVTFTPVGSNTLANNLTTSINGKSGMIGDWHSGSRNYFITITIPATQPTEYTVTFDPNGGTPKPNFGTTVHGVSGEYALPPNGITAPGGKEFDCWEVNGVRKNPGETITVTADVTVKALWKDIAATTYTISFDPNGGTGSMAAVANAPSTYSLPANGFTPPSGKQFKAWAVSSLTGEWYPNETISVNSNITLKAIWESLTSVKKEIFNVVATSSGIDSIALLYKQIKVPTFTVTEGAPAVVLNGQSNVDWQKKVSGVWEDQANGYFTPGEWRVKVKVYIGEPDSLAYKLGTPTSLTVDGESWAMGNNGVPTNSGGSSSSSHYSLIFAYSPIITIADDPNLQPPVKINEVNLMLNGYTLGAKIADAEITSDNSNISFAPISFIGMKDTDQDGKPDAPAEIGEVFEAEMLYAVAVNFRANDGYDISTLTKDTVKMNNATTVIAQYVPGENSFNGIYALEPFATYTVTFDANGGTGTMADVAGISGEYTLPENGFTAPDGKQFKAWSVGGVEKEVGDKITVTANTTVTAIWEAIEYTVTVSGSYASASGAGEYAVGETVNIYAGTKSGYTFNGWTSDDVTVLSASSKNASFVMPGKNVTVKANWTYNGSGGGGSGYTYYTIKATAGVNGSISPSGNVSVREGRDQTFTITPNKGYAVAKVLIDSKNVGAVKSYTFENVKKNHTIEVVFMKASGNPQTGVFVDVATGSYYEDAVDWAVKNGITKGTDDTHFSPDGICTRAQAVTFLWRAAGSPAAKSAVMPFADVKAGSYYYDAVLWAVENGIIKGTSETMFSPDATCSRAQIVTFLWRSQKSPAAGTANPFTDVKASAYYADAVLWAVKEDVTKGTTNTTFSPDANCTRAQIVTFIWRALAE